MKTIKLTNEQAAALYLKAPELRTTLLHDFTDEELGIKAKPLRWDDLGIEKRNTYPCRKDEIKALAHCQLLQLAKYYNKCDQHEIKGNYYSAYYNGQTKEIEVYLYPNLHKYGSEIKVKNEYSLEKCIEDNRDLWEIYLGVK